MRISASARLSAGDWSDSGSATLCVDPLHKGSSQNRSPRGSPADGSSPEPVGLSYRFAPCATGRGIIPGKSRGTSSVSGQAPRRASAGLVPGAVVLIQQAPLSSESTRRTGEPVPWRVRGFRSQTAARGFAARAPHAAAVPVPDQLQSGSCTRRRLNWSPWFSLGRFAIEAPPHGTGADMGSAACSPPNG